MNNEGSELLGSFLEKIKEIEDGLKGHKDENYDSFRKHYKRIYDFNLNVTLPININYCTGNESEHQRSAPALIIK